jgi:aerobic C4-dicarboxylate transport protein
MQLGELPIESKGPVPLYRHLYFQVLVAISIGILIGFLFPDVGVALKPFGDGFVKLVKMIIAPVIFLTVVTGISGLRELGGLGRLSVRALSYFLLVSTFALVVGLAVANLFQPGTGMDIDPASLDTTAIGEFAQKAHDQTIVAFLSNIIPDTLLSSQVDGNVLQVLMVAILIGVAASLTGERAEPVMRLFESASVVVFKAVHILMRAAPIGALGAMGFTVGKYGIASLINLAELVALFYMTSALFVVVVLGVIARLSGFSILRLIAYLRQEILLVLGTSSSEVALPGLIEKMERAGCRRSIAGVVVPLGYSFNLDGTNIYMTLAALFVAQACNVDLTLGQQLLLLAVAMISSKGAAGVTGAGFITLAATLEMVPGVPVAGLALILGVDRFMSECRSVTNFIGNAVATIVIARWEGGLDETKLKIAMRGAPITTTTDEIDRAQCSTIEDSKSKILAQR